eukprot:scaffold94960_cov18-Tisochrysis_lutea.AAC.1
MTHHKGAQDGAPLTQSCQPAMLVIHRCILWRWILGLCATCWAPTSPLAASTARRLSILQRQRPSYKSRCGALAALIGCFGLQQAMFENVHETMQREKDRRKASRI